MASDPPTPPEWLDCTARYCQRCCRYGRHWYGIERVSIDEERSCTCTCHRIFALWRETQAALQTVGEPNG